MAGMFYSIQEVSDKLGKSEDEIRQLVKSGRLREFRDGPNLLFKVEEVQSLLSDSSVMGTKRPAEKSTSPQKEMDAEAEEILLAPETAEKGKDADTASSATPEQAGGLTGEEIQLTDADTQIVEEGIKVLGETDTADAIKEKGEETFKGLGETPVTPAKGASLEEIEEDVSLDTFGSGSGLLDLSLQADDTSLGGILDEIYTPGAEGKAAAAAPAAKVPPPMTSEGSAMEVAAEADQMAAQFPEPQMPAAAIAAMGQAYAEPEPDAMSNALGIMLFIPLLAVIYTAIMAIAGFGNMIPAILKSAQGFIWYIAIGLAVASGLIAGIGAMTGREKKPKAPKPPKPVKEKKAK